MGEDGGGERLLIDFTGTLGEMEESIDAVHKGVGIL